MGSFKKLKSSDVITVPVVANKSWNFNYCPIPIDDPYITIYNGTNLTGSFTPGGEAITNGHYDRLTYAQINQLFYHQYSGSLSTASLASSLYYESASGLRPTASYFSFNNDPAFISYFPTASNASIKVISVSPSIYGQRILPYSLQMSSSTYNLRDDGKGNVYDNNTHVGNVFYPEGMIVITNTDYQSIFPLPPIAFDDTVSIVRSDYGNPATISIFPLANDDLRGNVLVNQSIRLSNSTGNFFSTGTLNTVSMSFSGLGIGTYTTDYSFLVTGSYCGNLRSNTATITINVTDPDCEFETNIQLIPTPSISITPSITRTPSISITPSVTRTPSISITPSVTATPSISITPSVTATPSITVSTTPSITQTPSISITQTPSISITRTPSISITQTPSITVSTTPSITQTPSISITQTPTVTPSISITQTPSITPSISAQAFTSFLIGTTDAGGAGFADQNTACTSGGTPQTVFVAGTEASLETAALNNKALYTDSSLLTVKNGGFLYFKTTITANTGKTFIVGSDGRMTSFNNCGVPPSDSPSPTPSISITQTPSITPEPSISISPSISVTPSVSPSTPASISVGGVGGAFTYDGFSTYYVDGFVNVSNGNVAVDTTFEINVNTAGGAIPVSVLMLSGSSFGSGTTLYGGSSPEPIGTACIISCDNPAVVLTGFTCP
jgi:hypothetical protein